MKRLYLFLIVAQIFSTVSAQTYPAVWTTPNNNITINANNSLTKTTPSAAFDAGIVSLNTLPGSTDGYLQFTVADITSAYAVSLSRLNSDPTLVNSSYSLRTSSTALHLFLADNARVALGTIAVNDVLKLSREASTMKVYKNGTVIYTENLQANVLVTDINRVDVSIYSGSVPPVVTSFRPALIIKPTIQTPGLANNDGSITLQTESAYNPVTYSWSSGETTSSITGKARGTYTVTATDAIGRTVTRSYYLGYPIEWTNLNNVTVNPDNSLTHGNSSTWEGASSVNILPVNTAGFIEFVLQEPTTVFMIGLSVIDYSGSYNTIDFAWYQYATGGKMMVYESGLNKGDIVSFAKGDVIRLERSAGKINYYVNGVLKRSVSSSNTFRLIADISISTPSGTIPVIVSSFEKTIRPRATFTFPNPLTNTGGGISITTEGTYEPSTKSWSSGETTSAITNKARGTYSVTLTDAASRNVTKSYRLGYPVEWTDLREMSLNPDNTLTKNSSNTTTWTGSAISSNFLPASTDGWIEFQQSQAIGASTIMLGLSRFNSVADFSSIDYAFYVTAAGSIYIYESGIVQGTFFASEAYDNIYTITREGSSIKYYLNGALIRTVTNVSIPTYQLHVDAAIVVGSTPIVSSSFGKTSTTYYAIANGVWNSPSVWSLTEGGAATSTVPGPSDVANVKGYNVTVDTGITSGNINITATNGNTGVTVTGVNGILTVRGNVVLKGENNTDTSTALIVQNDGKINVVNP